MSVAVAVTDQGYRRLVCKSKAKIHYTPFFLAVHLSRVLSRDERIKMSVTLLSGRDRTLLSAERTCR